MRRAGRRDETGLWLGPAVFGAATVLGAPLLLVGNGLGAAGWWLLAGPACAFAVIRLRVARGAQLGFQRPTGAFWGAAIVGFAAIWILMATVPSSVALPLAIGAALLVFARLERSPPFAVLALAVAAVGGGLATADAPLVAVQAVCGAVMLLGAAALRHSEASR